MREGAMPLGDDSQDQRLLTESSRRQQLAQDLLERLGLIGSWEKFGRPVIVGALSYGLFYEPDLDMEIYCPNLNLSDGFSVFAACSRNAVDNGVVVRQAMFQNFIDGEDQALYWQLRLEFAGFEWKADMWSARDDYPLPRSEHLIEPMRRILADDPAIRLHVLRLKHARSLDESLKVPSIDIYRAVISYGVRTPEELRAWHAENRTTGISGWIPGNNSN